MPDLRVLDEDGRLIHFKASVEQNTDSIERIKMICCGDTGPVRKLEKIVIENGPDHILKEVRPILNRGDIVFANLEAPFSERGKPLDRIPVFRLNPKSFEIVSTANINVVSLANNHMFDYGPDAFIDTLNILKTHKIYHFGAGLSINEALEPSILTIKGLKFGFIGFREKEDSFYDDNGVITPQIEKKLVIDRIKTLRNQVDWLVLSLHFGWEYVFYPAPIDVARCHSFIDAGADLIIGHHPHYPQGLEIYRNKLIIYSLGNFIWDQNFAGHTNSSYLLEIDILGKSIQNVIVIPFEMDRKYILKIRKDEDNLRFINDISVVFKQSKNLNKKWYFITRNKMIQNFLILKSIFKSKRNVLKKLSAWFKNLFSPRMKYTLKSFIWFMVTGRALYFEIQRKIQERT